MKIYASLSIIALVLLPSCAHYTLRHIRRTHDTVPLYLKMPKNSSVHENNGPLLYQALFTRLQRSGYPLIDYHGKTAYVIDTKIKHIRHPEKLISPDVVLYGYRCIIIVECTLLPPYEYKNELKKTFSLPILISNPKNPMLGSHFLLSATQDQLEQAVTPIMQWIEQITMMPPCR